MNDVEANEAVMNKHWFRQVADAEAPTSSIEDGSVYSTSYDKAAMG